MARIKKERRGVRRAEKVEVRWNTQSHKRAVDHEGNI